MITGEETQAELEAMLEKYQETDIEDTEDSEDTEDDESPETRDDEASEDKASEDKASAEKDPDPQPEDDAEQEQTLLAKDGKNIIPYQVLESERAEKNHAYQQLADLKSQLEQAQYRQQLLEEQISQAGMTPLEPEKLQLTPEKLQALREEMPDVADVVETLAGKTRHLEHLYQQQLDHLRQLQQQSEQPRQYEAQVALQENQTLTDWRDNDPERFRFACQVDNMMEKDPQWSSKPMADRFAEVTRRTLAAFGDPMPDTATAQKLINISQQKVQQALNSDALPDSPSQLGTPVSAPQNLNDRIASASGDELQDIIGKMTPQQIEDMLAGL